MSTFIVNGKTYAGSRLGVTIAYNSRRVIDALLSFEEWVAAYYTPIEQDSNPQSVYQLFTEAERKFLDYQNGCSGSYYKALIHTIVCADNSHLNRLAMGYPELVEVIKRYQNEAGYWQALEARWNDYLSQGK